MAQLKDTVVQGSLRATDTLFSTTAQFQILRAPTTSGGTTFGPGSTNNLLKSNGTSVYWTTLAASDIPNLSTDKLTSGTLTVARGGTGATSFTANSVIISGNTTTAALTTRAIYNRTTKGNLEWTASTTDTHIITKNTLAYWDGSYSGTSSNLTYCVKGTFGDAVTYGVDDATANVALGTGTGLTTERSVYYGLVTVNNASQTRATGIYAPTSAGTANQILVSAGGTSAPTWKATASGAAYATSANGALTFGTLPVAQGGTGQTSVANIQAGKDGDGNTISSTYLKLSGGTLTGNLTISHATNATMTAGSTNPKITFSESGSQPVHLVYTDYDSYRSPAGLKVVGGDSATPAWFEVEGTVYAAGFSGSLTGNVTGNVSGSSGSCTGNAATATTATNANYLISNTRMDYGWNGINYFNITASNKSAAKVNDTPFSSAVWTHILRFNHGNNAGYYTDLAIPFNANGIYYKRIANGSLQNSSTNGGWVSVLDELNYTSYTVTKTGSGASGTWGINVTGSAGSVAWANVTGKTDDITTKTTVVKQISRGTDFVPITSGYWAGMTTKSGISDSWWHILSMDWSGDDINNWISQLAIPT
jgi:hypothetical protein